MPKFDIDVTRTGIGFATIRVEAPNQQEAESKALDEAGNHLFSEKTSEYELTNGVTDRPHLAERHHPHPLARAIVANLWRRYRLEREMLRRFEAEAKTRNYPEGWLQAMEASKTQAWNAAVNSSAMLYGTGDYSDLHRELGIDPSQGLEQAEQPGSQVLKEADGAQSPRSRGG